MMSARVASSDTTAPRTAPCSNTKRDRQSLKPFTMRTSGLDGHRVERHRQGGVLVEYRTGLHACLGHRGRRLEAPVLRVHRAERELAPGADRPVLRVLEHLAHRIDAEDPV